MTILKKSTSLLQALLQRIGFRKSTAPAPVVINAVMIEKPPPTDPGTAAAPETAPAVAPAAPAQFAPYDETVRLPAVKAQPDIDFMGMGNLEESARTLPVSIETLEKWVGAGILSPEETAVAQRLIRILRENDRRRMH